jgi:hypothetical protein
MKGKREKENEYSFWLDAYHMAIVVWFILVLYIGFRWLSVESYKEAANETICHGTITKLERKGKKETHDYYGRKAGGKNMVNEGIRKTIFPQSGICILL